MRVGFKSEHFLDADGKPAGGTTSGTGFTIGWQNGPLGRDEERKEPNGAFVEDVIDACRERLMFYQDNGFEHPGNHAAYMALTHALSALDARTKEREDRKVEGTHEQ